MRLSIWAYRGFALVVGLLCVALLGGCASCSDLKVLKPQAASTDAFEPFYNSASQNEVVLKSDDFSLWLHPCIRTANGRAVGWVEGTVCATLAIPAGRTLLFSSDFATLQRQGHAGNERVRLRSDDFKFGDQLEGSETPARNNFLVYEAYKMAGRRWKFEVYSTADFDDVEVWLPPVLVNGRLVEVPKVRFSAEVVQRCVTYH